VKAARLRGFLDGFPPQINGGLIGNQFAAAGVFEEDAADFAIDGEAPKNISTSAMKEVWNGAKNFSLGAFARAGRAEQENRAVFHAGF
jgi:hypothetical protein